ncbi:MAG: hypothetical protein AB2747_21480 [Candidatus Thiodiazotropha taylori]
MNIDYLVSRRSKSGWITAIFAVGCILAFPINSSAQSYWSPYFSEESPSQHVCLGGLEGVRCNYKYCDNISLKCKDGAIGQREGEFSPHWISEEQPNNTFECPPHSVAVGIKCKGKYCDNLSVRCDPVDLELLNCQWSNWISEESGSGKYNKAEWPGQFLVGLECKGSYCDNKRFKYCEANQRIGQPTARWEVLCAGGQECKFEVAESLELGNRSEESWTQKKAESVANKISGGVKFEVLGVGISGGAEHTETVTETTERAASIVREKTEGYRASCGQTIDMTTYNIHAVWQLVISTPVDDIPLHIRTCQVTCTPDGDGPSYVPGAPEHIGSCLVERGSDWQPPAGLTVKGLQPLRTIPKLERSVNPAFKRH